MRNLFSFIARNYFFFVFLLLETLALIMVYQHQHYQRSYFASSANAVAGQVYKWSSGVTDYFSLRKANQQLAEENARLLHFTRESFLKTDRQVFTFRDTLYQRQYQYVNAEVVNSSVSRRDNYLTINKGKLHGIEPDMGVVTFNGIVGIVASVSDRFSSVISLLHKDMQISARIKKNDQIGTLLWEGYDYRKATMTYIPSHVALSVGDTIVSSGFSVIFPKDLFIGTISDFEIRRGDNYFSAEVELAIDFNKLKYVQVVNNLMLEEQQTLESQSENTAR
ncbi:MAG: rod shape-determining protein MreC [Bacteroidales bacterium]|jgi:rod shape-determining protein MreC|nr:rod shape-determining protein MreC [Bacteroidales bacterium]NLM91908.1 rod shape-determining protein MreC [Bacteroidales bacterium]